MKKLIFLLSIILLTSCGYNSPKLNDKTDPFIVNSIEQTDLEGMSIYYTEGINGTIDNNLWSIRGCICLPTGYYNIGDTITLIPTHHE